MIILFRILIELNKRNIYLDGQSEEVNGSEFEVIRGKMGELENVSIHRFFDQVFGLFHQAASITHLKICLKKEKSSFDDSYHQGLKDSYLENSINGVNVDFKISQLNMRKLVQFLQ